MYRRTNRQGSVWCGGGSGDKKCACGGEMGGRAGKEDAVSIANALPLAVEIWKEPDDMVAQWAANPWKDHHEQLVSGWCGEVANVADVGCGAGRYASVIKWTNTYRGYDQSIRMVQLAMRDNGEALGAHFFVKDILDCATHYGSDVVLFLDVAQHYQDPIGAINAMLKCWHAPRYMVSMVTGTHAEELSATTVVQHDQLPKGWDVGVRIKRMYSEPFDGAPHLSWVLMELIRA